MGNHHAPRGGGLVDDTAWVDPTAYINGTATVGARSYLGAGVYVDAGVTIGTDVIICDRVRVVADVPNGTTIECDCCSGSGSGSAVLQFDSINLVGSKLADYNTSGKEKGTLAYVGNDTFAGQNSVQRYYSLRYGEGLTADGIAVVNSPTFGDDGGQWVSLDTVNQKWLAATDWYIDIGGNDENSGTDSGHPLSTVSELNRRMVGSEYTGTVTIHQTSDITDPEAGRLNNARTLNPSGKIVWIGEAPSTYTATVTTYVSRTNTDEYRVAAPGIDALGTGTILKQTVGGLTTYTVINGILTTGVVSVNQPRTCVPTTGAPGSPGDPITLDPISDVPLRDLGFWPFPDNGGNFVLSQINMTTFSDRRMGSSKVQVVCCNLQTANFFGGEGSEITTCHFFIEATFNGGDVSLIGSSADDCEVVVRGGATVDLRDYFALHNGAVLHIEDGDVTISAQATCFIGVFDVAGGVAAIRAQNGGRYLGTGSVMYGSNNDAQWLEAGNGSQCGLGTVVGATLSATPLTVASVQHTLAPLPIAAATVFAGIRD